MKQDHHKLNQILKLGCDQKNFTDLLSIAKLCFEEYLDYVKLHAVEFLHSSERENKAGPKHKPKAGWENWGYQPGSVFVAGEKIKVKKPKLRRDQKEVNLEIYERLRDKSSFNSAVLVKALQGISCRDYEKTIDGLLDSFGVTKSTVSRELKTATKEKLQELKERRLDSVDCFSILIDGYHLGGSVFITALAIDKEGFKHVLGFWEGATENHSVCEELLSNLEHRGLKLDEKILFVTDGGKGIIKAIKNRYGKFLQHQRCTVHKDRNIQNHLPKKYRPEAHRRFRLAIDCLNYDDAKKELKDLEVWLEKINFSAAESLKEFFDDLLTVHRLKVPPLLRKSLHSTNPIESMFSQAKQRLRNIKKIKDSKMAQRWFGTALLESEKRFRRVKGFVSIADTIERIEIEQYLIRQSVA